MKVLLQVSFAFLLLFSACTKDSTPNEVDSVNQADKDFAYKAGQLYTANMEISRLAFDNSTDSAIIMLAANLLSTNTNAYNNLIVLGKNKGIVIPGSPDETHTNFKAGLVAMSGMEFDSAFVHNALQDQHNLLAEYNILKENGNNLMLKNHGKYYSDTMQVYHNQLDTLADMY